MVNLTGGGFSGGYRKYLRLLLPLLQADSRVSQLDVFIPPQAANHLSGSGVVGPLLAWPAADPKQGYPWLKAQLRHLAPDVVFIPTARWLDCGQIPTVVMVRNMEPLVMPFGGNTWTEGLKNLARAYAAWRACRRSTRVIAVSQYVRDFLAQKWRVSIQKVGVVYHGLEVPPALAETAKPQALQEQDLEQFLFTAGSVRPARGLEDLVKALAIINQQGLSPALVVGGQPDPATHFYKEQLQRLAVEQGVASQIVWAGQLNSLEMSWCFYNCAMFVMTSRTEACPNRVLEAMNHGTLSISGDNPPMPEFFQNSARFYKAGSADSLAQALIEGLNWSASEQECYRILARQRASAFSWLQTAENTILELEKACERCKP
jgi:glycosyltransferase involved in cell wall biosynthesis